MKILDSVIRLAFLLAVFSSGTRATAAIAPEEFVVGWPLNVPSEGALFDVPLDPEVYRYGRTLDELAILDQTGEPMPFYRVDVPSAVLSEEQITLGVSPIFQRQEEDAVADISVTTGADQTAITVTQEDAEEPESEIIAFIVDARDVESAPMAIELVWAELDRPFLMTVTIEHSEELTVWRRVGRGSVASLRVDGTSVTHGRIPVSGSSGGYYRVNWDRRVMDWELERVVLVFSELTEAATFGTIDVAPIELPPEEAIEGSLYFDLGGELPATAADLVFPAANRWANASIHWADAIGGTWRQIIRRRLFYDIDYEDQRFQSLPADFNRVEARYWRVMFDPEIPADGAELRITYPEEHLRFAANGSPPYMLVGGTLNSDAGPDPTFAAVIDALAPDRDAVPRLRLGERTVLGGSAALEVPEEFPWRTVLLWAALIAAAVTVGWMAFRLAREMSAKA